MLKTVLTLIICFSIYGKVYADLQSTIKYIEALIYNGKAVSIFCMDMQKPYFDTFYDKIRSEEVISQQIKLFEYFADQPNVFFVDVNYLGNGDTISRLKTSLKKTLNYSWLIKDERDAFMMLPPPEAGDSVEGYRITTKLDDYLKSKGVTDVVLTGCYDDQCVRDTAIGAAEHKYNVAVDRDMTIRSRHQSKRGDETYELWAQTMEMHPSIQLITKKSKCS